MSVFWMSWRSRPVDGAITWPRGVKGWSTESLPDGRTAYCARVVAADAAEARARIEKMYGRHATQLEWRFGPTQKEDSWWPDPTRFPR